MLYILFPQNHSSFKMYIFIWCLHKYKNYSSSPCLYALNNVLFVEETWTVSIKSTNKINLRMYYIQTGLLICIFFHVKACFVRKIGTYFERTKFYMLSNKGTKSPLQSPERFSCGYSADFRIMKALTTSVNQHGISKDVDSNRLKP
jgi:hypothetical protein